ncbi:MAG: hypothetical protein ACI3Y0_01890 [Prevotella sp.]
MKKNYRSMLPSGNSQQQGNNDGRQDNNILQKSDGEYPIPAKERHQPFIDQIEYQQRVKVVIEGKLLGDLVRESITMLEGQLKALGQVPIDSMKNNANKLVNQDIGIDSLEDMNKDAAETIRTVARAIHDSKFMSRYVEELTRAEREKWQITEVDKAMITGGDKVALVVLPVLGYYTGKHQLNDTILFHWLIATMPILAISAVWAINELRICLGNRKTKTR